MCLYTDLPDACTNVTYTDINECAEDTDGCAQLCTNTIGSYTCSCRSGYRLAIDGRWCTGEYSYLLYNQL